MPVIEVWVSGRGYDLVQLTDAEYIVGSDTASATIAIEDPTVSQLHAVLERVGTTWLVRDLGSRNGTSVNGVRLAAVHQLRHGDEILVGRTRVVFRDAASTHRPSTDALAPAPANITPAEKRVLVELCRPLLTISPYTPAASRREIAEHLFVGQQAVQANLTKLYDKFGIGAEPGVNRRAVLAMEAVQRGAVTAADLEVPEEGKR
jgi:pSer/pThr/pTyr-binding forkhead associated (FHA) protein